MGGLFLFSYRSAVVFRIPCHGFLLYRIAYKSLTAMIWPACGLRAFLKGMGKVKRCSLSPFLFPAGGSPLEDLVKFLLHLCKAKHLGDLPEDHRGFDKINACQEEGEACHEQEGGVVDGLEIECGEQG